MIPTTWNKETYQEFITYLLSLQDIKYKEFHIGLVQNSKYEIIGIRLPVLRQIAKEITNCEEFLNITEDKYYEEIMISGLVISHIKDEKIFNKYFKKHIKKIDNWALCDTFCQSIKIIEKYPDKYFKEAIKLSLTKKEFTSRVGLIMLFHFIDKKYLDTIFNTINNITIDDYYNNMAIAWLVCEIYTKYKEEATNFLKNNNLNKFTQNKTISKINDSYRVTKEEKDLLKQYKI